MPPTPEKIQQLALKWLEGQASPEEEKQLFDWYNEHQDEETVIKEPSLTNEKQLKDRMLSRLSAAAGTSFTTAPHPFLRNRTWWQIAASLLIILAVGAYFGTRHSTTRPALASTTHIKDLEPGADKAILTLEDGRRIVLDTTVNGTIPHSSPVQIVKKDGNISYTSIDGTGGTNTNGTNTGEPGAPVYNTISTPRKGQFHIVLSDGTAVWLDAESSIRFPTSFTGAARKIEITGQAYLAVTKDAAKPFYVKVPQKNTEIAVLGTQFNISAYENEAAVRTTLLDGSVRVTTDNAVLLLNPGQQASIEQPGSIRLIRSPDLDQVMAWKNGMFNLTSASIEEIMRQVARWYDAEVVYEGDLSRLKFSGEISRKKNVSELLQILEATGTVRFKIDGKKITVIPAK